MEIASLVVAVLSLVVNIVMCFKVNDIQKNALSNRGNKNKSAIQAVRGKYNKSSIEQ